MLRSLLVLMVFSQSSPLFAERKINFCTLGPRMAVEIKKDGDGCDATFRIQALKWKCTQRSNVSANTNAFLKEITSQAARECRKRCRERGSKCRGAFTRPTSCGLSVEAEDAMGTGKRVGCHSECTGPAFSYCSIYHTGVLAVDRKLLATMPPNCRCKGPSSGKRRGKKKDENVLKRWWNKITD